MPDNRYTDEQVDKALRALVLADMKPALAHKRLIEKDQLPVPVRTLRDWRNQYAEKLVAMKEHREWVAEQLAESWEEFNADALAKAQMMLTKIGERDDWDDMNVASLARAAKDVTTMAAIAQDKGRTLRDLPTQITESRDLPALLRALSKFEGVVKVNDDLIEGTAEEVDPKEIEPCSESSATAGAAEPTS